MPFPIEDGVARWELTGTRNRITELTDEIGVAKSTLSEVLHRPEGAVIEAHLERAGRSPGPA